MPKPVYAILAAYGTYQKWLINIHISQTKTTKQELSE